MKKQISIVFLFALLHPVLLSQEKGKWFDLNGYITTLGSAMFDTLSGDITYENVVHNRLNMKTFIGSRITIAADLRTRLFMGDMVKGLGRVYPELTGTDPGFVDMSWNLLSEKSFFLNTTVDRLWADISLGKFQARIGRQRINWGQTLVWNPNDIFNVYSFFDVDYPERPGSDAVRLQYYPSSTSSVELAAKMDRDNNLTVAGLTRFNRWGYDLQAFAGFSDGEDIVAGAGWSGSIGSVSFRGEGTWFHPAESFSDTSGAVILTIGADKIFNDNSMLQFQVMYSSQPLHPDNFAGLYARDLKTRDIAFSEFTAFGQFTWAVTPLLNIGASLMWFPDLKGYFTGPSVDFSAAENTDFSLMWQHFNGRMGGDETRLNLVYLRVKFNF
jgi:hypothetical protein